MKTIPTLDSFKEPLSSVHKALVLLSSTPNVDSVSAALGLAVALKSKGIDVQVACPADMRVEFSRLVGVDEVKKKIGNRNLVISFPSSDGKIEKVSYVENEDKTRADLIIAPRTGVSPLDPAEVSFSYSGAEADATFMVGVNAYADLGDIYESERNVIEGSLTVALTLFPVGTYAKYHADGTGYSSLSEMVVASCVQLGLPLDQDSASNFLFGIESITQGLSTPTVNADTFETVALLLRSGGRRQPIGQQGTLSPHQMPFMSNQPSVTSSPQSPSTSSVSANNNPFAAALSKSANQGGTMPAGYSATGELKG
jgi:hypothetical protein